MVGNNKETESELVHVEFETVETEEKFSGNLRKGKRN